MLCRCFRAWSLWDIVKAFWVMTGVVGFFIMVTVREGVIFAAYIEQSVMGLA